MLLEYVYFTPFSAAWHPVHFLQLFSHSFYSLNQSIIPHSLMRTYTFDDYNTHLWSRLLEVLHTTSLLVKMDSPRTDDREPLLRRSTCNTSPKSPEGEPYVFRLSKLAKFCLLLDFLVEFSNSLLTVPVLSLLENAVCETYYRAHDQNVFHVSGSNNETLCKIAPVQAEVATLRGWKAFFETISGSSIVTLVQDASNDFLAILVAIPVGHAADQGSNRALFAIIAFGMTCALLWTIVVGTFI